MSVRPVPLPPALPPVRSPLAKIRFDWGDAYEVERGRARRRDGLGDWLEARTADELAALIAADYLARPVPRDADL